MGWFRSHCRFAAVAALLALLIQLTLSFGHVHGLDGTVSTIGTASSAIAASSEPDTDRHPGDPPRDLCAICITGGLLAAASLPPPPLVPLPPSFSTDTPQFFAVTLAAITPRLAFRSRAPPIA